MAKKSDVRSTAEAQRRRVEKLKIDSLGVSASPRLESSIFVDMKKHFSYILVLSLWARVDVPELFGDTLVMFNNSTVSGTIIQTNRNDILMLTDYAAFNFSLANIKRIKIDPPVEFSNTNRLPNFKNVVLALSRQQWATNLAPIAATVIDKGILRNVPYSSFRCGEDYEVNIYGDLDAPAGVEIGMYRSLLDNASAKQNCVNFIREILGQVSDREIVQSLGLNKDIKTRDGLTFEITPPTDDDAYNGWWISIYSEKLLNQAQASDKEMNDISVTKADAFKDAGQNGNASSWSANELGLARPSIWPKITFTNLATGTVVTDADVVHVDIGVSLTWEKNRGADYGWVRLEDLPEALRNKFGCDPKKTAEFDAKVQAAKAKWQQDVAASAAQAAAQPASTQMPDYGYSPVLSDSYSGGGRVYVHGYFRKNGTYVQPYTRSYPHRR